MTLKHQSQRISACKRHPSASPPPGGFCAPCLRERLECIDPSTLQEIPNYSAPRPETLRRCRSYAAARREIAPPEPSRKSCGARCRDSLSDLFDRENGSKLPRGDVLSDLREEPETEILRDGVIEDISVDQAFDGFDADVELKSMKEFIDLEVCSKKQKKDFIWVAASAFTHKLRKLRRKDKIKIRGGSVGDVIESMEDSNAGKVRETQSEVGEYGGLGLGLGRRSCDTDPRLSLDAGRFSLDDSRWCFDKPRASLDGYFHQSHRQNQRFNPMVSFLEDVKVIDSILRNRGAMVEKMNVVDEEMSPDESVQIQTHDYYKGSSYDHRRRSFDCSNSLKRGTLLEVDELKLMSNAKVSPATTELFYGAKLLTSDRRLMDSNTKHCKNESLDSIESHPKVSASVSGSIGDVDLKGVKKLQKWGKFWNIWGIKQKKCLDSEKFNGGDLKSLNFDSNGSNSGFIHGSSSVEAKAIGTRLKEESVLQRNQSIRYSPSHIDSGLLRFYLTPLRSYRSKSVKSRLSTVSKVVL